MSNILQNSYLKLADHYTNCLNKHGDTSLGMDWPDKEDNIKRFSIMLDLFKTNLYNNIKPLKILDFGCGTSHFYEHLKQTGLEKNIKYTGIDIIEDSIEISKKKFPENKYFCLDILDSSESLGQYDYIVINGLFTQKCNLNNNEMKNFLIQILTKLFPLFDKGLAFNTMSNQVDFKRDGAFHLDLNWSSELFTKKFTRKFVVRHDYDLYENTFYLYKEV